MVTAEIKEITSDERYEMLERIWSGEGQMVAKEVFSCHEEIANEWLIVDNRKGEFSIVEFILKEDLDRWLLTGTLPSDYWCEDVQYPSDPSEIDFIIGVGKDKFVTVTCKLYEGFYMENEWAFDRAGVPDESLSFCEEAVLNLARRECKKRHPEYFNPEPKQEKPAPKRRR